MGFSARGLGALTTLLGSLLLASAPLHAAPEAPATTDTIRIGQTAALSGPLAELGTELRDGADAYLKWINSKGGIHGKKIELVSEDDAYVPERAVQNVKKQLDNVGAIAVRSTPVEFGKMIESEVSRWREVATKAGLQPQ